MTLCSARAGTICVHKRNIDKIIVGCAINANKETCSFAETDAEHTEKIKNAIKKLQGGI